MVQRLAVEGQDFDEAFSPEENTPENFAVLREELLDWLKYTIPLTLSERATSAFVARHGDHDTLICGCCWKFNTPRLMFTQAEVKKELVDIFGSLEWFEKFVMQMSIEDLNQALWNVQCVRRGIPWLAKNPQDPPVHDVDLDREDITPEDAAAVLVAMGQAAPGDDDEWGSPSGDDDEEL